MFVLIGILAILASSHCALFNYDPDYEEPVCECVLPQFCADRIKPFYGQEILGLRELGHPCPKEDQICCHTAKKIDEEVSPPPPSAPSRPCGSLEHNFLSFRMTSKSHQADYGELPWTVMVLEKNGAHEDHLFKCGGSLIHPRVVLTVAHCVYNYATKPDKLVVRAGEWDVSTNNEPVPHQDRTVDEVLIFPSYDLDNHRNDLAMIFLSSSFDMLDNVGLMCISNDTKVITEKCMVSGWGRNSPRNGSYSSILKKVEVPLVARNRCQSMLRKTALGNRFLLDRSFICAGAEEGKDACTGDGGGPLICPSRQSYMRYVQVGLVAWGMGCGAKDVPGVYVNLMLFNSWIDEEMMIRGLETDVYRMQA